MNLASRRMISLSVMAVSEIEGFLRQVTFRFLEYEVLSRASFYTLV